jgi:hypothetical protein
MIIVGESQFQNVNGTLGTRVRRKQVDAKFIDESKLSAEPTKIGTTVEMRITDVQFFLNLVSDIVE